LVEKAVSLIQKNHYKKILEIGTGSGAIGLSLLGEKLPLESVTLTDISEKALSVAKINAKRLKRSHKVFFHQGDLFEGIVDNYDLVITNPPYIKKSQASTVHFQVNQFEPHLALYLEDEIYQEWFSQLFVGSHQHLCEGGVLMMEGHEDELQGLQKLAKKYFSSTILEKDYTNRIRFLIATK
jgi:release factor glutamine methyltransferase